MRDARLFLAALVFFFVTTDAVVAQSGSSSSALTRCARIAGVESPSTPELRACLAEVPSTDWGRPLYIGLRALLFYRSDSYEAGDFDRDEYLALVPAPRSDETEAFILRLGVERAAAIDRRHAAISLGEARGRASAVAEASLAGCRATIDSSGRVVVEEFCSGTVCVEGRELEGMSEDRARLHDLERTLDRTRMDVGRDRGER